MDLHTNSTSHTPTEPPLQKRRITYANAIKSSTHNINTDQVNSDYISAVFNKFLDDFKTMFNQLLQQNSMILQMLTMLIGNKDG